MHAMHLGVTAADRIDDWPGRTDWLLFDADNIARPELVDRLPATAEDRAADFLSTLNATDGTRAWYWLLMPSVTTLPCEAGCPDGRGDRQALAIGQCMLLRRSAYDRVGGWSKLARLDDVRMAHESAFTRLIDTTCPQRPGPNH